MATPTAATASNPAVPAAVSPIQPAPSDPVPAVAVASQAAGPVAAVTSARSDAPQPRIAGDTPKDAATVSSGPAEALPSAAPLVADPVLPQASPPIPAAAAGSSSGTHDVSPAGQVAPALVSLAQAPGGAQRLTLHLEPATLGHVQIQIDRAPDATARVEITVQRPQTLDLLIRDQPQLQHALDQAGVPADGRTLTLHLAPQDTSGSSFGAQGGAQGNTGFSGGFGTGPGSSGFGNGSPRNGGGANGDAGTDTDTPQTGGQRPRVYRAGLDITA